MNGSDVILLGLDVGTTTTSCLMASAKLCQSPITGQSILDDYQVLAMQGPIFTPYLEHNNHEIDSERLESFVVNLLKNPLLQGKTPFSSGALITGLAAQKNNADEVSQSIRKLLPNSILAIAGDPHYESWLAFMANSAEISETYPETPIINLDIGGGTTNVAVGLNGEIIATGSYYIGARHFEFETGTYRLKNISSNGHKILNHLKIKKNVADYLNDDEVEHITQLLIRQLDNIISNKPTLNFLIEAPIAKLPSIKLNNCIITFSGGVGGLLYQEHDCKEYSKTHFGDLGIELANQLRSSVLYKQTRYSSKTVKPKSLGRATLYGLAFHSAELSGKTNFISENIPLPLEDIPLIGLVESNMDEDEITYQFSRLEEFQEGAAFQLIIDKLDARQLIDFANKLSAVLLEFNQNINKPLVFFVSKNIGLSLGNLLTQWRKTHQNLFVFDELPRRTSQLIRVGKQNKGIVPVHYYAFGTNSMCINIDKKMESSLNESIK